MGLIIEHSVIAMVPQVVRECFATDRALLSKWHIAAPGTLDQCVKKTVDDIYRADCSFRLYIARLCDGPMIGYWGTEHGSYINLIFVKPIYRSRFFMKDFWQSVCDVMPECFTTSVYTKNHPAIAFYTKLGRRFREFSANGHPATCFVFDKKEKRLCR